MKRSKHSLSHYRLVTADMGKLVPVGCFEVLPGDSVQQATSMLLRVSPLVAPVMHPVSVRVHHWFVPHRLVWDGWEDFITGADEGAVEFPSLSTGVSGWANGSLGDYLGIPPGVPNLDVSLLPARSYALIFNEFYRDQDIDTPLTIDLTSGADSTTSIAIQNVREEKDYFTTAMPFAQKGGAAGAPVNYGINTDPSILKNSITGAVLANQTALKTGAAGDLSSTAANVNARLETPANVLVSEMRKAARLQEFLEAAARGGHRLTEWILHVFGVKSSDARVQRPEYLGGGKTPITISEVLTSY